MEVGGIVQGTHGGTKYKDLKVIPKSTINHEKLKRVAWYCSYIFIILLDMALDIII